MKFLCRRVCLLLKYVLFVLDSHFTRFVPTRRATQQTPDTTSLVHASGQKPDEQENKHNNKKQKKKKNKKHTKNKHNTNNTKKNNKKIQREEEA